MEALIELIQRLRSDNGCPWDKEQTPQTMVNYLKQEVRELTEAIHSGDAGHVCEELGDVLFQILFIIRLFEESKDFTFSDVTKMITEKMIRRHPHVFGNETVASADEVRIRWQEIKKKEKGGN